MHRRLRERTEYCIHTLWTRTEISPQMFSHTAQANREQKFQNTKAYSLQGSIGRKQGCAYRGPLPASLLALRSQNLRTFHSGAMSFDGWIFLLTSSGLIASQCLLEILHCSPLHPIIHSHLTSSLRELLSMSQLFSVEHNCLHLYSHVIRAFVYSQLI